MKNLLLFLFIISQIITAQSAEKLAEQNKEIDTNKVIVPELIHPRVTQIVSRILARYHFNRQELNDSLSAIIFDNYISSLDRHKLYFLKSDMDKFSKSKLNIDEYLFEGKLQTPFNIFNVFKERLNNRMQQVLVTINKYFDFSKDETIVLDREDAPWAVSDEELNEVWRKRLKNEALRLKLTGKEKKDIQETLTKRYKNLHKLILQYTPEDVFQLYLNSYTDVLDPHTSYFSPITSDNFKIDMSLSLEGIGAQLTVDEDYTKIARIIPGGPAAKSGLLKEDDRIIGVAQENEKEFVDVIGWRLNDVVQLIRGKKGTTVRLNILKAEDGTDAMPEEISIVRDKVKLEEQAAKKEILTLEQDGYNFKLGVVKIPSFYIDFEGRRKGEPDYKSTTRDVKRILEELKNDGVDGVIVDLRNNGGGSLEEAIDLTGLFINEGAVVQVKDNIGRIEVNYDPDTSITYDGPLAVLVNRYSASASEIFSGAVQDYGRGIIIGENTFGKGTVQNLVDLDRFLPGTSEKLGQLKLTFAKFYRVNGGSTQNKGVAPDISFPTPEAPEEFGESSRPSALPWDKIQSAPYKPLFDLGSLLPKLIENHDVRMKNNHEYQYWLEDIEEYNKNKERKEFSLNEEIRKKEREENEKKKDKRDEERGKSAELKLDELKEIPAMELNTQDFRLAESGYVLADYILLSPAYSGRWNNEIK